MSISDGGHLGNPRPAGEIMFEAITGKPFMGPGEKVVAEMLEAREHPPTPVGSRVERYRKAAETYRKFTSDGFIDEMKDVLAFMSGETWSIAIELLKVSGEDIHLGWLSCADSDNAYYLDGNGFGFKYDTESGRGETRIINPMNYDSLIEIVMAFRGEVKDKEVSFIDFVHTKLDEIAEGSKDLVFDKK